MPPHPSAPRPQVLHNVHVKNRCAWLNHSSNPRVFPDLVRRHPNVRMWFSGHFHLSHDYARSIGIAGGCAFVSCNVIGSYNRDGLRQSRVLKGGCGAPGGGQWGAGAVWASRCLPVGWPCIATASGVLCPPRSHARTEAGKGPWEARLHSEPDAAPTCALSHTPAHAPGLPAASPILR